MDTVEVVIPVVHAANVTASFYWYNWTGVKCTVELDQLCQYVGEAVTADGTNYTTITVVNGSDTLATRATSSVSLTAGANDLAAAVAATAVGKKLEVAAGGVLKVTSTKSGSGVAVNGAIITRARRHT